MKNGKGNWDKVLITKNLFDKIQEAAKLLVDKNQKYQYNTDYRQLLGVSNEWIRWRRRRISQRNGNGGQCD
jgi:hypothetical protein